MPRPIMKAVPIDRRADGALVDQAPRQPAGGAEEGVGRRAEREAARCGLATSVAAGLGFDGERLLGEDVLAGGERPHGDVEMRGGDRQVEDEVDVWGRR